MRMACCLQSTCTCCSRNYRSCCYYRFCLCCCSCNSVPVFTRKVSARATEKWKCNALFHMAAKFHTSPQGRSKCVLHTLTHTHTHACMHAYFLPGRTDLVFGLGNIIYAGGMINNNGVHWLPHGLAAILAFETVTVILQLNIKSGNLTFTATVTATATATVSVQHRSGKFVPRLFCFYTQIESEISLLLLLLLL